MEKEKCPCGKKDCFVQLPPLSSDEGNSYETQCGRIAIWQWNGEEFNLCLLGEAEQIANGKGWSLHYVRPTLRGLKVYVYRSIPGGGLQREINAASELEAAQALTRPRK